jgi:hypothetical protein
MVVGKQKKYWCSDAWLKNNTKPSLSLKSVFKNIADRPLVSRLFLYY